MTSAIAPPRRLFAPCSPITQASASTTLDLPDPFGPTTQVIPGSKRSVVVEAKDLKPRSVRVLRYKREPSPRQRTAGRLLAEDYSPAPTACGSTGGREAGGGTVEGSVEGFAERPVAEPVGGGG